MDDPSLSRSHRVPPVWYAGVPTFLTLFLVCSISVIGAAWLLPPLSFIFGSGWFARALTIVVIFLGLMLFRRILFWQWYGKVPDESEAALLEYFTQQNDHEPGTPDEHDSVELIENALHLRDVSAGECMAPREEVVFIPVSASLGALRKLFAESKLSRIIVTDGDTPDKVRGYVHVQQMFSRRMSIRQMVMPIRSVPAAMPVNELLSLFVRTRTNIACVHDEHQQFAGIVTMEDALEQLFGAIDDEHD